MAPEKTHDFQIRQHITATLWRFPEVKKDDWCGE